MRLPRPAIVPTLVSLLALAILLALPLAADDIEPLPAVGEPERLSVLLLDYHAPIEHDVLLSHLCVDRCTRSRNCPDELLRKGVDYFNDRLEVYRPQYMGQSARFLVNAYKAKGIDLVSISGHHASGFSGNFGRGRFYTDELAHQLAGLPGRDAFFTDPSMVMLHGCWTDVKSGFEGDPIEYVRHIIEDTSVRRGESERLLAAIQQIAGDEEAYRDLFPNACILGYAGTQIPGGLFEIYGQVNNLLRGMEAEVAGRDQAREPRFPLAEARRSRSEMERVNKEIDRECSPGGWPCNLCRQAPEYYGPLARALTTTLERGQQRLERKEGLAAGETLRMERTLEEASFYSNTRWSCAVAEPGTPPVYPEPIDRAPYLEMFVDLLMIDLGQVDGEVRHRIESELTHLLGATEIDDATRERLHARLTSEEGTAWRYAFSQRTLGRLSTFRQRDFYDFLSRIGCQPCFEEVLRSGIPRVTRENAASQLRPRLGRELYEKALADRSPRVRLLAASRLQKTLGMDLFEKALADPDERVRKAAAEQLAALESGEIEAPHDPGPAEAESDL